MTSWTPCRIVGNVFSKYAATGEGRKRKLLQKQIFYGVEKVFFLIVPV